jgi:serine/threonine-protein kinase
VSFHPAPYPSVRYPLGVAEPEVERLAHFRIVEKLGEGGMGIVYKAFDERLERTVALKVLPASFAGNEERKRRFLREARSAAAVTHANIATLHDVREHEGRVFLVMELVEGKTLGRLLKEGPLTVAEALRIARGIARGLARAHERGIVHRDLKPDNVMIDAEGEVKILDFGLAKTHEAQQAPPSKSVLERDDTATQATQAGRVIGTPGYMSPEQAKGKDVDARCDVFAFGVVLYEMLTGQKAFKGETPLDMMIALTRDDPMPASRINAAVTPEIERVLERCLAKVPADRYASARELAGALEAVAPSTASGSGSGSGAITASSADRVAARASRARFGWGLAAIGALGAVIAVLAAARPGRETAPAPPVASGPPASAPATTAITELPPPKTSSPAAASEYAAAVQSFRDGSMATAGVHLQRATQLDPAFAAAHLMQAVRFDDDALEKLRVDVNAAAERRTDLSARDVAILEVCQVDAARDVPDYDAMCDRWSALSARFPGDALVAEVAGVHCPSRPEDALRLFERAVSLDPKFAAPWMDRASALTDLGRYDDALDAANRCLAATPTAASCLHSRAALEGRRGECGKLLEDARTMIAIEPSAPQAYSWLARALVATNAPIESVEDVVRRRVEHELDPEARKIDALFMPSFASWLRGDLADVARAFPSWQKTIDEDTSDSCVSTLLMVEGFMSEELGHPERAVPLVDRYMRRLPALVQDSAIGARPTVLWVQRRAKRITDDEFRAKRDEWVAAARAKLPPSWAGMAWFTFYAMPARTPDEAREALDALPKFEPLAPYEGLEDDEESMGRVLLLAGRGDDAEPHLRRAATVCAGPDELYPQLRATGELGQVLESRRDVAGACEAYARVIARWGGGPAAPKPRPLLVEDARARAKKLGCKVAP